MDENISTLRVENLVKIYGKRKVVKGISFEMKSSEIVGLLGPNGAGKTTTFFMIVGFIKANGGKIFIDDKDITDLPMYKRSQRGLAYLPQEPSIFRKLSVKDNVRAVLEFRKDLSKKEIDMEAEKLIENFGLEKLKNQKGYTLSGGERRRTEIARCLASKPKFLLLDEPFAGIDPIAVREIKDMIKYLSSMNIGVLITDHNVRDALAVTTCAHIISMGNIIVSGTKDELLKNRLAIDTYFGRDFEEGM